MGMGSTSENGLLFILEAHISEGSIHGPVVTQGENGKMREPSKPPSMAVDASISASDRTFRFKASLWHEQLKTFQKKNM